MMQQDQMNNMRLPQV